MEIILVAVLAFLVSYEFCLKMAVISTLDDASIAPTSVIVTSVVIVYAIIVYVISRYFFKKIKDLLLNEIISDTEFKRIKVLTLIYMACEIPPVLANSFGYNSMFFGLQRILSLPLYYIIASIVTYVPVFLLYRIHINPVNKIKIGDSDNLKESVGKIFNSQEFYTALSSSLHKGNSDEEYGLDYIPYMLQNLSEKRMRFRKSSNYFLITTVCFSLFFVSVTIFFGYILLNAASVGVYKDVNSLSEAVNDNNKILSSLKIYLSRDDYFSKANSDKLAALESPYKFDLSGKESVIANNVERSVRLFNKEGNLVKLREAIQGYKDTLTTVQTEKSKAYVELLNSTVNALDDFTNFRDKAFKEIVSSQKDVVKIVPQIQANLNKPINVQNELIKRLILSAVVVTFFITILRYFRGLYQSHYNEMLKAEQNDLLIRKFYVTFKSSEGNSEERKIVLANFLSESPTAIGDLTKADAKDKANRIENDVLKEILNAMLKKI